MLTRPQGPYYNGCTSSVILGRKRDFLKGSEKVGGTSSSDSGDHLPPQPGRALLSSRPHTPTQQT